MQHQSWTTYLLAHLFIPSLLFLLGILVTQPVFAKIRLKFAFSGQHACPRVTMSSHRDGLTTIEICGTPVLLVALPLLVPLQLTQKVPVFVLTSAMVMMAHTFAARIIEPKFQGIKTKVCTHEKGMAIHQSITPGTKKRAYMNSLAYRIISSSSFGLLHLIVVLAMQASMSRSSTDSGSANGGLGGAYGARRTGREFWSCGLRTLRANGFRKYTMVSREQYLVLFLAACAALALGLKIHSLSRELARKRQRRHISAGGKL